MPSDLEQYEERFTQVDQTNFTLKHLTDELQDLHVQMIIGREGRSVEWDGLPRSLMLNIEQDFELLTKYPL